MVATDCARAYRANSILTASPGQLVLMLFDGALKALGQAREAFARPPEDFRRIAAINQPLLKAQNIIAELQGSLRMDAGDGQFAREMERLYDYEVERLLGELRDAWAEMLRKQDGPSGRAGPADG